ncbi:hypothetical protein EBZ39_16170, partial [bacterium]|nr:hypothetical protein [bacterium]
LAANGGNTGILTVADSSGFEIGATVFLAAKNQKIARLKVSLKPSNLTVVVVTPADMTFDASQYTVANNAKLFQPKSNLFVTNDSNSVPISSDTIIKTTSIAVANAPELVLNGDIGDILVVKQNGVEKLTVDVNGHLESEGYVKPKMGVVFADGTTQTTASVGGGGGGGSGWTTLKTIDFMSMSNQTISSNGTVTIGGVSWTYDGSSGARINTAIVNGTGLVFSPKAGADWWAGMYGSAPELIAEIKNLLPTDWHPSTPIRFWAYVEYQGLTINLIESVFGVEVLESVNSRTTFGNMIGFGRYAGGQFIRPIAFHNGSTTAYSDSRSISNTNSTFNVLLIEFPLGFMGGGPVLKYAGTWANGWPTKLQLTPASHDYATSSMSASNSFANLPLSRYRMFMATKNLTSSATPSLIYKAIKIECKSDI